MDVLSLTGSESKPITKSPLCNYASPIKVPPLLLLKSHQPLRSTHPAGLLSIFMELQDDLILNKMWGIVNGLVCAQLENHFRML